ncbi:putative endonuclease lcl3 [Aphanomyces cochlioides]|nr:putative endonuclease lcl3 [Aphanomyces cochlioides]
MRSICRSVVSQFWLPVKKKVMPITIFHLASMLTTTWCNGCDYVGVFILGVIAGYILPRFMLHLRRYETVKDIPETCFEQNATFRGQVVAVSDGDTFRVRHVPFLRGAGSYDGKMTDHTLQIRLAGIDTPELPHFGRECQPYAKEAKAWLESAIKGATVTVQLLRRDQYGRAGRSYRLLVIESFLVCMVTQGTWPFTKNLSDELLKVGLAKVYRLSEAVYGGRLDLFNALEAQAKQARLNVWSL